MLIEFSVGNYRAYKEVVTLSLLAAPITSKNKALDEQNCFSVNDKLRLLKSAVIYGANASGKSKLLQAIGFMKRFVIGSAKDFQSTDAIPVEPFRLSTETEQLPSYFQIVFYLDGKQYRYGFEATSKVIISEWLYHANIKETRLFIREGNKYDISSVFKEGRNLPKRTRANALFLSVVAQFNGEISQKILNWFHSIGIISGLSDMEYQGFTLESIKGEALKQEVISLVKQMDMGISGLLVEERPLSEDDIPAQLFAELKQLLLERESVSINVVTQHKKYDEFNKQISIEKFNLDDDESEGTKKFFYLSGPILDTLKRGDLLVIDELDARLHPIITAKIVQLFNSKMTNPQNAQLVFATHDTNLLSRDYFRRDQIWFTEKDRYGATDLYSLAEYKIRNDASFEKDYIAGKYGAIPFIGDIERIFEELHGEKA